MWERPRSVRTEIISVDTDRIVRHAFGKSEFAHIRAVPVADGVTLLTVTAAGDWDGRRHFWFKDQDAAAKVINRIANGLNLNRSTGWRLARRRAHRKGERLEPTPYVATRVEGGGVLVEASTVDAVLQECLTYSCFVPIVSAVEIHQHIARVKQDIDRSLVRWQVTGAMKTLNQQYKALRLSPRAPGEKIPSFKVWLTAQLEAAILQPVS